MGGAVGQTVMEVRDMAAAQPTAAAPQTNGGIWGGPYITGMTPEQAGMNPNAPPLQTRTVSAPTGTPPEFGQNPAAVGGYNPSAPSIGGFKPMAPTVKGPAPAQGATGGKGGGMPAPSGGPVELYGAQSTMQTTPKGPAPSGAPSGGPPNMFQQAANATNYAMAGAANEMQYQPMQINAGSYQADQVQGGSYNPSLINGNFGVGAGQASASNVDPMAAQMTAAQVNQGDIDRFMNPYTSSVIDASMNDINRMSDMQRNQAAAEATRAGAFGGSRGALMEAEVLRNAMDQQSRTGSQLRSQGFSQAVQNAQQDANRRQGASQFNAGSRLQALQGNQSANLQASISNANNVTQANMAGARNGLQAALANQGAENQASQFGLNQAFQAGLANQGANATANQFNIGQDMQAQALNNQFGLQASNQRLNASNSLANIGNLGFGQAQSVLAGQQQAGNQQQALIQALIGAGQNQWNGFTNAPQQSLGLLAQALGASPIPQSNTQTYSPGVMDWMTAGTQMAGTLGPLFMASDRRLKSDITEIGSTEDGHKLYSWNWNEEANDIGLEGSDVGVIAQEVQKSRPDLIHESESGYLMVDYGGIH